MYHYDDGDVGWMTVVMPLMWMLVVGLTVWLAVRFARSSSGGPSAGPENRTERETPEEILDRRFASGEIDAETHAASRRHLKEHGG